MHLNNTLTEYGFFSKVLHWLSAILLFIQIPLGFYLVDLDFGEERLTFENIHIILGLTIFYLVIIRLLKNIINPTPKLDTSIFKGQKFLAKMNHVLLYVTILSITISGILKKLFNGESLVIIFKKINLSLVISFLLIGNVCMYFGNTFFNFLKTILSFLYNLPTSSSALKTG